MLQVDGVRRHRRRLFLQPANTLNSFFLSLSDFSKTTNTLSKLEKLPKDGASARPSPTSAAWILAIFRPPGLAGASPTLKRNCRLFSRPSRSRTVCTCDSADACPHSATRLRKRWSSSLCRQSPAST